MLVYLIIFLYTYVIAKRYNSSEITLSKIRAVLSIMFLPLLFAVIRDDIGIDYANYYERFIMYAETDWSDIYSDIRFNRELLNVLFVKIVFFLGGNSIWAIGLYSIATLLLCSIFIYEKKKIVYLPITFLAFLSLFYPESYNIIRQALAVAVVFWGTRFLVGNKSLYFIATCLIASAIHNTAALSLVFLPLNYIFRYKNSYWKVMAIITLILFVLLINPIMTNLMTLSSVAQYYGDSYEIKNSGTLKLIVIKFFVLLPFLLNYINNTKKNPESHTYYLLFMLMLLFQIMAEYSEWAFRLTYYCFVGEIMLVGITVNNQKPQLKPLYLLYFAAFYIMQFYVQYYSWGWSGVIPYKSFLF